MKIPVSFFFSLKHCVGYGYKIYTMYTVVFFPNTKIEATVSKRVVRNRMSLCSVSRMATQKPRRRCHKVQLGGLFNTCKLPLTREGTAEVRPEGGIYSCYSDVIFVTT